MNDSTRSIFPALCAAISLAVGGPAIAQGVAPSAAPAPAPTPATATAPATVPAPAPLKAAPAAAPSAATVSAAAAKLAAHRDAGEPRAASSDRVDLDATTVTGNQELPKVMYIVPWKKSDIGDLAGKPMNSLLDEVLAPVDRDVFRREVKYYDAVHGDAGANGAPPAGAPGPAGRAPQVEK